MARLFILLLFLLLQWPLALAQSVTIHPDGTNKLSIEATSALNLGYRLQSSTDGSTWQDLSDQASGTFSYSVDPAQDHLQFFRLRTFPIVDTPITVVLVGDSTVADFTANESHFYGWGQGMYDHMKSNVQLINLATPAQSSLSFLTSVEHDNMILIHPDFVLVQFGMMDTWEQDGLYTSLTNYEADLKSIVQTIRDFQGTPILVTPPTPGYFNGNSIIPYLQDRSAVVRKVSQELQTYLIDLNQLTADFFTQLGPTQSNLLTWSDTDRTHFTLAGSKAVATLVVNAFPPILASQAIKQP